MAAILTSFRDVEREVRELATEAGIADAGELPVDALTDLLAVRGLVVAQTASAVRGLVVAQTASAVRGLAVLRDLAVHGRGDDEVNAARASEFTLRARGVLNALRTPPLRLRVGPAGLAGPGWAAARYTGPAAASRRPMRSGVSSPRRTVGPLPRGDR